MEGKYLMEDKIYLATQFTHEFMDGFGWNDEKVRDKNFSQTPNSLIDLRALIVFDSKLIELISILLNAGMSGKEIILAIHEAAAIRQWELKEKDKEKAVEA